MGRLSLVSRAQLKDKRRRHIANSVVVADLSLLRSQDDQSRRRDVDRLRTTNLNPKIIGHARSSRKATIPTSEPCESRRQGNKHVFSCTASFDVFPYDKLDKTAITGAEFLGKRGKFDALFIFIDVCATLRTSEGRRKPAEPQNCEANPSAEPQN